jgi:integrase
MAYKHALGIRDENERVFRDSIGGQLWPSNITKRWKKIRTELGFEQVRLHDLRHSYAVNSLRGGAPLEALSDAMGHHSITVTKDIYAKSIPGSGQKVSDAFNSMIVPAQEIDKIEQELSRALP